LVLSLSLSLSLMLRPTVSRPVCIGSYLNGRLYSVAISNGMFVDHSFTCVTCSVPSWSPRICLHGNVSAFPSNECICQNTELSSWDILCI
jgi:hypothetical protein